MSLLAIRDVSKRFGGVNALAGVTFEVEQGDILGIIGPNGAGKTTLLNCISGLYRPDAGDIRWETTSIRGLAPYRIARLGIGRTFQIVRPFPSMTVRENTAMGALFGRPGARLQPGAALNEADMVLDVVGLGEKRHYPVLRLTVPDRKRLEVARALAMRPRLLLLDEVMAGLNQVEIEQALEMVRRVRDSGVTIVLIEHVMKVIVGVCRRAPARDRGIPRTALRQGPGEMSSLLQVDKLTAGFGMTPVLFEVDLELATGELVALIGANGAGKSTLLGALSGLVRVSSGTVRLSGRRLTGLRPEMIVASGMVHVPQGRRLFSTMTVERNLLLGAYRRHDRQVREDLERILGYFPALRDKLDREAGTLSGGEQQMVAIGRGLMARPTLLMIDEPSLGLAPNIVDRVMEIVKAINQDGTAVLLVEQDVVLALDIADRGYVLENGRIAMHGRASDLRRDPAVRKAYLGV